MKHKINASTGVCTNCGISITQLIHGADPVCQTKAKEDNVVSLRRAQLEKYAKENGITIVNLGSLAVGESEIDTDTGHAAIMDSITEFAEAIQKMVMENEPQKPTQQFNSEALDKLFDEVGSMGAGNASEECQCQACIDARSDEEQPLQSVPQKIAVLRSIQTVPFPLNNFTLSSDLREVLATLFEDNLLEENDDGTHIIISSKGIEKLKKYDAQTAKMAKPEVVLTAAEVISLMAIADSKNKSVLLSQIRADGFEHTIPKLAEHRFVRIRHSPLKGRVVELDVAGLTHVAKILAITL